MQGNFSAEDHEAFIGDVTLADFYSFHPRWVAWGYEGGRKVPYNPHSGRKAASNDPTTWAAREYAAGRCRQISGAGVGIMLGDHVGGCIGGVDLDGCRDRDTGELADWAVEILTRFDTYTEVSPSRTGLKALFRYDAQWLPELRDAWTPHAPTAEWGPSFAIDHLGPEVHLGGRWYAVTGERHPGAPAAVRAVSRDDLLWLISDLGPTVKAARKAGATGARESGTGTPGGRSEALMSLACRIKREGGTREDLKAELGLPENAPARAHVEDQGRAKAQARAIERAWERAIVPALDSDSAFDSEPPSADDSPTPTAPGDWTIAAFDADGDPDLSHDQLALDLGKAGWDRDARYCGNLGGWFLWRGQHWEPESGMRPMGIVRGFMRSKAKLLVEWAERKAATLDAEEGDNPEGGKRLLGQIKAQAKALRQDACIAAVERLARSNPKALATDDQWDCDDFLLATPGGTVDLRTGELREARRTDYITRLTSVAPAEPGVRPEAWLRFLAEVFPDDPDMPAFIQRLAGYALTGSTREHRMFLLHGSGRNGKGTLLNTLQAIMGDYARGIPTAALLETRSPQHSSPIAQLRGARFVRGAELPVGQVWDESLVKQLTGGDTITARLMRQDGFDFVPKFTLIVDGNTKPRIRTTDVAMRSRMTLIPFTASFAGREDRGLPERLAAEAGAILRWAIDGAVEWQRGGLRIPAAVEKASREYLDSEDLVGGFLSDETERAPAERVEASILYGRYRAWCDGQGIPAASQKAFSEALSERGIARFRTMAARGFMGLRLRGTLGADPFAEGQPGA
jgi:P4 family phage/plasmid primase-like protien